MRVRVEILHELVRDAVPFALKLYESLLDSIPTHGPLLVATCSGFTQYAYAFIETDAIVLGDERHEEARALRERALRLYLRGRGYCLRAMDVLADAGRRGRAPLHARTAVA